MRKQIYNDDLSLLGQRVRPIQPRPPAHQAGDRYRLYTPTSAESHTHHHQQPRPPGLAAARELHFTAARAGGKKITASRVQRPTVALKINNVDDVTVPVAASGQLMKISEAHSVHELLGLLQAYTSTSSPAAAGGSVRSGTHSATARSTGVQVYERCFLQHCTRLRDALAGTQNGDQDTDHDYVYSRAA